MPNHWWSMYDGAWLVKMIPGRIEPPTSVAEPAAVSGAGETWKGPEMLQMCVCVPYLRMAMLNLVT